MAEETCEICKFDFTVYPDDKAFSEELNGFVCALCDSAMQCGTLGVKGILMTLIRRINNQSTEIENLKNQLKDKHEKN